MGDAYVPEPMTCHPWYADRADGIRTLLHLPGIFVADIRPLSAFAFEGESPPLGEATVRKIVMDVRKCAGPAPFVGDPLWQSGWYHWKVAVDHLGRHVAGEATLGIWVDPKF